MQSVNQPAFTAASVVPTHLLRLGIQVERKQITFDLKENPQGQFLRITEEVKGRRNTVIVPLPGLEQFRDAVNEVIEFSKSLTQNSSKRVNWFTKP